MVIAMPRVLVVQMPVHQIVDVIPVRHGRMAATRAMHMAGVVAGARVPGSAGGRIRGVDVDAVLVIMPVMGVVQVAVVQVIHVAVVPHGQMSAAGAVHMRMIVVNVMGHGLVSRSPLDRIRRFLN